jgi:hypothetical protein
MMAIPSLLKAPEHVELPHPILIGSIAVSGLGGLHGKALQVGLHCLPMARSAVAQRLLDVGRKRNR